MERSVALVLLCLEDSGDRVPQDWLIANFTPQSIAEVLYLKLQALRHVRYTQPQQFLANAVEVALRAAAQADCKVDEVFRVWVSVRC